MGKCIAAAGRLLPDALGLIGAGLVSWGAWQIFPPAGFIVAGALLMSGAWLAARGSAVPAPPDEPLE